MHRPYISSTAHQCLSLSWINIECLRKYATHSFKEFLFTSGLFKQTGNRYEMSYSHKINTAKTQRHLFRVIYKVAMGCTVLL